MFTVFLDRDGTINREVHHLRRVDQLELLDGAAEAIRLLNEHGARVVVVTNQAAIGRGLLNEAGLDDIHAALDAVLAQHGARIDAVYSCPHHPTEAIGAYRVECSCRKPRPGSLQRAALELGVELEGAFMIGDKRSDLEAGRAVGCRTILVRTGYGQDTESELRQEDVIAVVPAHEHANRETTEEPSRHATPLMRPLADHVANNLLEAVQWILAQRS